MNVRTPQAPAIVLSLGFEWDDLFADPAVLEQQRLGFTEKDAQKDLKAIKDSRWWTDCF